jgi:ABC-type transport system involved in multi-copper enzyme maturation permease subunit
MYPVFLTTFKGLIRDRVLQGVMATAGLFLLVPVISTLSMRQVVELSITLSLGLFSFLLLLLTVFLGATSLWKDFERRYTFSVLGLPLSRNAYLLGKFFGMAGFILLSALILGALVFVVVGLTANFYPPARTIIWTNILFASLFAVLKYVLLLGFAFLFSSVSTSFFLPVFGTIAIYFGGSVTQEVYDYLQTETASQTLSPLVHKLADIFYYVLPNFGSFDLQLQATYGLEISSTGLLLTFLYFAIYLALLLCCTTQFFRRRELN